MFEDFVQFVRDVYCTPDFIPLHEPCFTGNEKKYLLETIDSTFVSSVGAFVDEFECKIADYTGVDYAVATVSGTTALHTALLLAGVGQEDEVISQSLTFVATCNAIRYCGATPVFVDVDRRTLGLSPESLAEFLETSCEVRDDGFCWNRESENIIRACVPMHTFGFPVYLDEIKQLCDKYNIILVEDAAESLGSYYKKQHTGTIGTFAVLSFNGNKIMTCGGGGMILTNNKDLAARAKHLTTTAKVPHKWAFDHDEVGYNYRLPNLNAALGVAQLEQLPVFVKAKRELATQYQEWGEQHGVQFVAEPQDTMANYWLNAIITKDQKERDTMLEISNASNVMTRPAWIPMHMLAMNQNCQKGHLANTEWLYKRLVNVPSSVKGSLQNRGRKTG